MMLLLIMMMMMLLLLFLLLQMMIFPFFRREIDPIGGNELLLFQGFPNEPKHFVQLVLLAGGSEIESPPFVDIFEFEASREDHVDSAID